MEISSNCSVAELTDPIEPQYCETKQFVLIVQAIYLAIIILASLLGNATILFLVVKFTALQYRSILVSLSVVICDLLLVISFHLPALVSVSSGKWIMGYIGCQIIGITGFYLICVRWMSMAVICLDRFSYTLFPLSYPRWSKQFLVSLITAAWFLPAIMLTPSVAGEGTYSFRPGFSQCILDCGTDKACLGLYISLITSQVVLGAVLPCILYTIMYCISRKKRRLIQMGSHHDLTGTVIGTGISHWSKRDKRALQTFITILVVLLISNIPVYILTTIRRPFPDLYKMIPISGHMIIVDLFYATNFLNPLLIIRNRDIHKAFLRLFKKQSRRLSMRASSTSTIRRSTPPTSTNNIN